MDANLIEPAKQENLLGSLTDAGVLQGAVSSRFLVVGTPAPGWTPVASALNDAAAMAGMRVHSAPIVFEPGAEPAIANALKHPGTRVVALVEHPQNVLARALLIQPVQAASAVTSRWVAGARLLLRHVQEQPGRLTLLEADEAEAAPDSLAALMRSWAPAPCESVRIATPPPMAIDPIHRLVAGVLLAHARPAALQIYDELIAACLRLPDAIAPSATTIAESALERYRATAAELAAAATEAAQARQLEQMHANASQTAARAEAALADARRERAELEQQHRRTTAAVELLVDELHQAQQEAEEQFLRAIAIERHAKRGSMGDPFPLRIDSLQVVHVHEGGRHRHVDVVLVRPARSDLQLAELALRLVDHGGNPGLAIFATRTARQALSVWEPDGEEHGRSFMLLVPSDARARDRLLRLGTSDWSVVLQLARLLKQELVTESGTVPAHWQATAARLVRQLEELPTRLRYDGLDVASGSEGTAELCFERLQYATLNLARVRLRISVRERVLRWIAPEALSEVPFGEWPADANGRLCPDFVFPLGGAQPAAEALRLWSRASPSTQALLLSVLVPMLGSVAVPTAVRQAARSLYRQARWLTLLARARAIARRLLRRGGADN